MPYEHYEINSTSQVKVGRGELASIYIANATATETDSLTLRNGTGTGDPVIFRCNSRGAKSGGFPILNIDFDNLYAQITGSSVWYVRIFIEP